MKARFPWLDDPGLERFAARPAWLAPTRSPPAADLDLGPDALARAFAAVRRSPAPGVDGVTADAFAVHLGRRLRGLSCDIRTGRYRPAPLLRLRRPKPDGGERVLGIPTIADRVVQRAVHDALEPSVEPLLLPQVHGWRRGRSTATAIAGLRAAGTLPWIEVAKADFASLFDTLPHAALRAAAAFASPDPRWIDLLDRWLRAWPTSPGRGVPQGAPLSPLLANLVLDRDLDRHVGLRAAAWARYGDDVLAVLDNRGGAMAWLSWLDGIARHAGLALSPAKVAWSPAGRGPLPFAVLGHRLAILPEGEAWRLVSVSVGPGVLAFGGAP